VLDSIVEGAHKYRPSLEAVRRRLADRIHYTRWMKNIEEISMVCENVKTLFAHQEVGQPTA